MAELAEKDDCTENVSKNELTDLTYSKVTALKEEMSKENGIDHRLYDGIVWKNSLGSMTEDALESDSAGSISCNGHNGSNQDEVFGTNAADGKYKDISEKINILDENGIHVQANKDDIQSDKDNVETDKDDLCIDSLNWANSHIVNISSDSSEGLKDDDCEDGDSNAVKPGSIVVSAEDSSMDSLSSCQSSNSGKTAQNKDKDSIVSTVKDEEGAEILITLNEENAEKDIDEKSSVEVILVETNKKGRDNIHSKNKKEINKQAVDEQMPKVVSSFENGKSGVIEKKLTVAGLPDMADGKIIVNANSSAPSLVKSGMTKPGLPSGAQLLRQGNQYGYVTNVGSKKLFVPVSIPMTVAKALETNPNQISSNLHAGQLKTVNQPVCKPTQSQPQISNLNAENVCPKSSWELIELMRWEVQNRIPDNFNWSIVFSARKEDLGFMATFLQELGSDVIKEQVYEDIIKIQTAKKESGDLKDTEIDSLEKMKTVYENTKKKVEHFQLDTIPCIVSECDFKTESPLIMDYHKDFPHYIPPWDTNKGWMACSHCDFKTKVIPQFVFHMDSVHRIQAKFSEKEQCFQCPLCPFNASTKNKLERHQPKCTKNFKLNVNLQPLYDDINFCLKACFYKPPKPVVKVPSKPMPPPPKIQPRPTMQTRKTAEIVVIQPPQQPQLPASTRSPRIRPQAPTINVQTTVHQHEPKIAQPNVAFIPLNMIRPGPLRHFMNASQPRTSSPVPVQKPVRPPGQEMSGFEVCELCGGYVKDRQALRIHFYYAHKVDMPLAIFSRPNPPLVCDVCKSHYWTTHALTKHKTTLRHFTSSHSATSGIVTYRQCFICVKKVSNLFVHIEQVHGKTMKDLVLMKKCIMCGITAANHRFLEMHLASVHGIHIKASDYVEKVQAVPQLKAPALNPVVLDNTNDGKLIAKVNFCVFCEIHFPDNLQLTMHCVKIHASCDTCGMVVVSSKCLATHNCKPAQRSCYICGLDNMTPDEYVEHLRGHVKPCKVRILKLSELEIEDIKEKIKHEYKPAVISLDSEDSDVEVIESKPSQMQVVLGKDDGKHAELSEEKTDMHITVGCENKNDEGSDGKFVTKNEKLDLQNENDNNKEQSSISDAIVMKMKEKEANIIGVVINTKSLDDINSVNVLSKNSMIDNNIESKIESTCVTNMAIKEVRESEKEIKSNGIESEIDEKQLQKSDDKEMLSVVNCKRKKSDSDTDGDKVPGENTNLIKRSRLEEDFADKKVQKL